MLACVFITLFFTYNIIVRLGPPGPPSAVLPIVCASRWIPSWCHIESEHILRKTRTKGISIATHPSS